MEKFIIRFLRELSIKLSLVLLVALFCSCEGYNAISGIIVDYETNLPLDSVFMSVKSEIRCVSDSSGSFHVGQRVLSFVRFPLMIVKFQKPGYKDITKHVNGMHAPIVIYMKKDE